MKGYKKSNQENTPPLNQHGCVVLDVAAATIVVGASFFGVANFLNGLIIVIDRSVAGGCTYCCCNCYLITVVVVADTTSTRVQANLLLLMLWVFFQWLCFCGEGSVH